MSIIDYASLKTIVADYLHRSDLSDAVLSNFVQLAEARLNRKLRLLQQETTADLNVLINTNEVALPSDWVENIDLLHKEDKRQLTPQSVRSLNSQRTYDETKGRPNLYATTNGHKLLFDLVADQNYTLSLNYFQKWDIETDDVNWLLLNAPDAYLYASLIEAKTYTKKPSDVALWAEGLEVAIGDLNKLDNRSRKNAKVRFDRAITNTTGRFDIVRGY